MEKAREDYKTHPDNPLLFTEYFLGSRHLDLQVESVKYRPTNMLPVRFKKHCPRPPVAVRRFEGSGPSKEKAQLLKTLSSREENFVGVIRLHEQDLILKLVSHVLKDHALLF